MDTIIISLISVLITGFVYLFFPVIYRAQNGKVSEKKGKKIALINSIVLGVFFFVVETAIGLESSAARKVGPAVIFYFISKSILIDVNITDDETLDENNVLENDYKICSNCGQQIFQDEKKCTNCGKYIYENDIVISSVDEKNGENIMDLENGKKAYEKGNECYDLSKFDEAFSLYLKSAQQGYSKGQCDLGYCYEKGIGTEIDENKAFYWYKKSAEQGYSLAQYNLGICYEKGIGVQKDLMKAKYWYEKSLDNGNMDAEVSIKELNKIIQENNSLPKENSAHNILNNDKFDENNKKENNNLYLRETILDKLKKYEPSYEYAVKCSERYKEHTPDKFPYYVKKLKENSKYYEDLVETLIIMYYEDAQILIAIDNAFLCVEYLSEQYLILFTDKKYIASRYINKDVPIRTKHAFEIFYELFEKSSCKGIVFNPFTETQVIFSKDALDGLHLDLMFDVPWNKKNDGD